MATPTDPGAPSGPPDLPNVPAPAPIGPLPASGNVIGIIQITDAGQIRIAQLKAAATPAAAGDPSLVVALSPNSPIPPGANVIGGVIISAPIPAGSNKIGEVDIVTMPDVVVTREPLTPLAPDADSVGVASAVVVAANADRRGLVLTNLSDTEFISFGLGVAAVLYSGITLGPRGVWVMDRDTFTLGDIEAIASLAATALAIQEFE